MRVSIKIIEPILLVAELKSLAAYKAIA
jgi:hypothetical protein